jgi:hypothetical protein
MTPEAIIEQVAADGVRLALSDGGKIKASGDQGAVTRWLPIIREQKPGIVAALQAAEDITVEPAAANARPVYWERADGSIVGPAVPEFLAKVGTGLTASYWVVCQLHGQSVWVLTDRLRSRKAFEEQSEVRVVQLLPGGFGKTDGLARGARP